MKIAVIGATGPTGIHFVEQALAKGHSVTVLARSPEKLTIQNPRLTVVAGDVFDKQAVMQTVSGQEAVFIALGTGKSTKKSSIREDGTRQIMNVLAASGEKPQVVVLSALGVGESKKQYAFYWHWVFLPMLRHVFADHAQQEAIVRASGLTWTILRPTFLKDNPATGKVAATPAPKSIKPRNAVNRADVAAFALSSIEKRAYMNQALVLTGA